MTDYIELDKPTHKDRIIHKIYTPKEIVKIIQENFMTYHSSCKLNRGEMLILWEFSNWLIREFKDD